MSVESAEVALVAKDSIQRTTHQPPDFFSRRVPVEEVSEALRPRTGSDLRSTRDLEGRSSSTERAQSRHRPPYARQSPGRREPYHQSQAAPAAALPPSKRRSSAACCLSGWRR